MARPPFVRSCMVTGTGARVGKTLVATALVQALRKAGVDAIAMKPVARGVLRRDGGWHSDEVQRLAAASAFGLPQHALCAHWLPAARDHGQAGAPDHPPSMKAIIETFHVLATWADAVVVEDSPELAAHAHSRFDGPDLARRLGLPAVLVVGLTEGCVPSALDSARSLAARGVECAGWVANHADGSWSDAGDTAEALRRSLPGPCLGSIPRLAEDVGARGLDLRRMLLALAP